MDKDAKSKVAKSIADRLRLIAEQVKQWESRDVADQIAAGSLKLSRPAYFLDLERFAEMLEGTHFSVRLKAKVMAVPQNKIEQLDRDFEIAEFIHEQRNSGKAARVRAYNQRAIEAAMAEFNLGYESCERCWDRLKYAVKSENPELWRYSERLVALGLATKTTPKE